MIAQQNDDILAAGNAVYRLTQEEQIRQICEAREDYYRCQRGMQRLMEEQIATVKRQEVVLKEQANALTEKDALIASLLAEKKAGEKIGCRLIAVFPLGSDSSVIECC